MKCASCGTENEPGREICNSCGSLLSPESTHDSPEADRDSDGDDRSAKSWFGKEVTLSKLRWRLVITSSFLIFVIPAVFFGSSEHYANSIMMLVLGVVAAWITYIMLKNNWTHGKSLAIGAFLIAPLFIIALIPWQDIVLVHDPYEDQPRFELNLQQRWVNGTTVVVEGTVTNTGGAAGYCTIVINAFSGYDWTGDIPDDWGSLVTGTVVSPWIEPHGGTGTVYWEHTFENVYWNSQVSWEISGQ